MKDYDSNIIRNIAVLSHCLLYTSDAADDHLAV